MKAAVRSGAARSAHAPTRPLLPLSAIMLAVLSAGAQAQSTPSSAKTLPTVTVNAAEEAPQDGHRATATRVGKVLQDPHDIPQAVTTVTNTLMEEQQVGSLKEALRNVSGLSFNAAEGGRSGDNMNLRGFYTFGDMYLDGIRDTAQYNRETFNLEQIDVLRGSAAMLFGRGQAGGVINQVTKTPLLGNRGRITGSVGIDDYREVTGDFNKELGDSTAVRLNVMKRDEGSWRSNPADGAEPEIHREGVGLSLVTGLYTDNEFTFNHYYLKTRDNPDYGISFDPATKRPTKNFSADTFWGTNNTFDDSDTSMTSLVHQYKLSSQAEIRTQLRHASYERVYWAQAPERINPPSFDGSTGSPKVRQTDTENLTLQSDLTARAELLGMKHELLAGVEYLKEDSSRWGLRDLDPGAGRFYRPGAFTSAPAITYQGDTLAFYAQDTIEFVPNWKLTLGARHDSLDAEYSSLNSPQLDFSETSLRTGLSWHPNAYTHYYISYSDSFSPTADLYQLSGGSYPAERSKVTELGAKWMLMEGDLALRAALYRADKEWERNTDLESTAAILTKKRRTDGLELEVAGRVTPNWEVFSGFSLMDAEILEVAPGADARLEGQRPRNTPKLTFNLWSTYALGGGWKIGGGVEAKSDRYAYVPTAANANSNFVNGKFSPNTAPGYARWDAMLAYEQKTWAARLNVKNIFDRVYYDAVYDQGGFAIPGSGRAIILTGEYKF
ncbi:MAG: TonB-dependent siderophore receptor [Thauera sp.]|nr:TonB-dependent siderophore receptor [Thauera sp.]